MKRFGFLRVISTLFMILGVIAFAVGVAVLAAEIFIVPTTSPSFSGLVAGLLSMIGFVFVGQWIRLGLAIEENTRLTAEALRRLAARRERSGVSVPQPYDT